tara:strand:+ start:486 stop:701 length:216 start_codon:yes stop_codon:yes gene_type:complete
MTTDDELRDFFAAFAMNGIIARGGLHPELMPEEAMARRAYELADEMIEARKPKEPEVGIAAIKSRRKKDDQ